MSENAQDLHPETLAKFEALEKVRDLRTTPRDGSIRVDTPGLLADAGVTPAGGFWPRLLAVLAQFLRPRRSAENSSPTPPSGPNARPPDAWYARFEHPAVFFLLGLGGVLLLGWVACLALMALGR